MPLYIEIKSALQSIDSPLFAAELHGMICGFLLANPTGSAEAFVKHALGGNEIERAGASFAVIAELYEETRVQLQDSNLGLQLLLPDEETAIAERLQSACDCARGIVLGLAFNGVSVESQIPEDTRSFLQDCYSIGQSEFETSDSEEDERVYAEFVEYLRTGVLLAQEEVNFLPSSSAIH